MEKRKNAQNAQRLFTGIIALVSIFTVLLVSACSGSGPDVDHKLYGVEIGTVTGGNITANKKSAAKGQTVTLTLLPDPDHVLDTLSVSDTAGPITTKGSGNTRTFEMRTGKVTVTGSFISESEEMFAITVEQAEHGTITTDPEDRAPAGLEVIVTLTGTGQTSDGKDYIYQDGSLIITDKDGIEVDYELYGTTGTRFIFEMPFSPVTITALFMSDGTELFDITNDEPEEGGSMSVIGKAYETQEVTVTLTIAPAHRYVDGSFKVYKTGDKTVTVSARTEDNLHWTFEMPAYPVTVTVELEKIPMYTIVIDNAKIANGTLSVVPATSVEGKIPAGTEVTVTLTIDEGNYEYKNDIKVVQSGTANAELSLTTVTAPAGADYAWTFTVPAVEATDTITVSATVSEIPAHAVTVNLTGADWGNLTFAPKVGDTSTARQGREITVTLTFDEFDYKQKGSLTISRTSGDAITPETTNLETAGNLKWTFTMPAEAVTISAELEKTPRYKIMLAGGFTNGSGFSISGVDEEKDWDDNYIASYNKLITIGITPDAGYKVVSPLSDVQVVFTRVPGTLTWTFKMPAETITLDFDIATLGSIYAGGAKAEITVSTAPETNPTNATIPIIELNANVQGHNGNARAIKITGEGVNKAFALTTAEPIDLNGFVALSFWAKTDSGQVNATYLAFGDNNVNRRVVYVGETNAQNTITFYNTWTHYIIPLPQEASISTTSRPFILRATIPAEREIYFDDIEFITSGVTLDAIQIQGGGFSAITFKRGTDVEPLIKARQITFRYKHNDGTTVTLWSEPSGNNLKFNLREWMFPQLVFALNPSSNADLSGTVVTPKSNGGDARVTVSMGGVTSNEAVFPILEEDIHIIGDFSTLTNVAIPTVPVAGTNYFWQQGDFAGGFFLVNNATGTRSPWNETLYNSANSVAGNWRIANNAAARTGRGGGTIESADLSEYSQISFWINIYWQSAATVANAKPNVKPLIFDFELRNEGTRVSATTGTYYKQQVTYDPDNVPAGWETRASGWIKVVLPLSGFAAGLDLTAVTGWAFEVKRPADATPPPPDAAANNDWRVSLTYIVAE